MENTTLNPVGITHENPGRSPMEGSLPLWMSRRSSKDIGLSSACSLKAFSIFLASSLISVFIVCSLGLFPIASFRLSICPCNTSKAQYHRSFSWSNMHRILWIPNMHSPLRNRISFQASVSVLQTSVSLMNERGSYFHLSGSCL